ncbi:Exodeoxyribonuclease 7 large subunit [Chlamydiales bacterium STE3]|nr:Exodeoxyribonuclease 7 large subunit [Chlamydiales bacterium STE3]
MINCFKQSKLRKRSIENNFSLGQTFAMFNQQDTLKKPEILTVSALTEAIKFSLEKTFPFVSLQGEVSNCKLQSSGHLYFSLKDNQAQIGAVMFRLDASKIAKPLKDGDQVIVKGSINVYPATGKYQIVVRELQYAGLGELLLKLEELKIKLLKRGFFKKEFKKPLPKCPKKIGVVTSPTGAVIQDILNVLTRRFSGFHLILNPVKVQGEGAAQEIAQAIDHFNKHQLVDVLIIGRGGGSIEDLWAFNEEIVAESIFNSSIPIISAVGHETDHCIADYVADVRAPTPSAAAEMVIAERMQELKALNHLEKTMQQLLSRQIKQYKERLKAIAKTPRMQSPYLMIGPFMQSMDSMKSALDRQIYEHLARFKRDLIGKEKQKEALKPTNQIQSLKQKLSYYEKDLQKSWKKVLDDKQNRFKTAIDLLKALDPKNLLSKGYSIVFSEKENSIISSIHSVKKEQEVKLLFADGYTTSIIKEIYKSD